MRLQSNATIIVAASIFLVAVILAIPVISFSIPVSAPAGVSPSSVGVETQTLNLDISGQRFGTFTLSNIDTGGPSVTSSLVIFAQAPARVYVETLTVNGLVCPSLTVSNSDFFDGTISNNVSDGQSLGWTQTSTVTDVVVGSGRGQASASYANTAVDRVVIKANNTRIRNFTINSFEGFTGGCEFGRFSVGTVDWQNSQVGDGSGIDNASFVFATSTRIGLSLTVSGNTERPLNVR